MVGGMYWARQNVGTYAGLLSHATPSHLLTAGSDRLSLPYQTFPPGRVTHTQIDTHTLTLNSEMGYKA